ncbi:MAG: EcsC family protein [Leptolyngbyaceae cyanobacterium RM2_2_4]|nr:EcsC family protein [Leptolyngbyaceae cyanobacterium RM2_2_4]
MASISLPDEKENLVDKVVNWIVDVGIKGIGTLPSAEKVAADHLSKCANAEEAIDSIIKWRTAYAGGTGFVTGLGGIVALPLTLPVGLAASYALGANLSAAIAYLRGYDIHSDQVRTMILMCLVGEIGEELLKGTGIAVGTKLTRHLILHKIPKSALSAINKRVGFKLLTKTSEKGAVRLIRIVPIVGGIIGGAVDGVFVNTCGKVAKKYFPVASSEKIGD